MEPPLSPSKFPMSPGMPVFPISPERAAGTKPPYGAPAAPSPLLPDLRTSPLRKHRRDDSDVSVHGLATMFENLEVKDFKDAQAKFTASMQKLKTKHASDVRQLEKENALGMSRRVVRIEELEAELDKWRQGHKECVAKDVWDAARQEQRSAITKWENAMKSMEQRKHEQDMKMFKMNQAIETYKTKCHSYRKDAHEKSIECKRLGDLLPSYQGKLQGLERTIKRAESDLKFHMSEAEKYKNQVFGLQVDVESVRAQREEEIQTLNDKLRLVEGERDALKTNLKEEEVLRIATEGQIPLPTATNDEHDEFGSPLRSPRKQRSPERNGEDKENVAPRKTVVELKLLQQELATEKSTRQRAQEQIEFMKMECQFRCCSCRIADYKGSHFIHDSSHATEMERMKASVPTLTPPSSSHEDDPMEGVVIKQEPIEEQRPFTPPAEEPQDEQLALETEQTVETPVIVNRMDHETPEPEVVFSPATGTFRAAPSPTDLPLSTHASTPAKPSRIGLLANSELKMASSPWTPDAHSTVIPRETTSSPVSTYASPLHSPAASVVETLDKSTGILIHEDAVLDSDDEDVEPSSPLNGPPGPATPGQYLTRTVTTTTTIPLHFSPATPAMMKAGAQIMTPSTVAHAPMDARTPVLGELSLNKVPFDREAALEAIRERRGRARSMAAGQGTPRKQMMEGIMERRDISAPVSRIR